MWERRGTVCENGEFRTEGRQYAHNCRRGHVSYLYSRKTAFAAVLPNSAQDAAEREWRTPGGGVTAANDRESPLSPPPIGHVGSNPVIPPRGGRTSAREHSCTGLHLERAHLRTHVTHARTHARARAVLGTRTAAQLHLYGRVHASEVQRAARCLPAGPVAATARAPRQDLRSETHAAWCSVVNTLPSLYTYILDVGDGG